MLHIFREKGKFQWIFLKKSIYSEFKIIHPYKYDLYLRNFLEILNSNTFDLTF